jgi:hypothetical protein
MARLARIVVPHLPHHVTQRGNRREPIFFKDGDQDVYRDLLTVQMRKASIEMGARSAQRNSCSLEKMLKRPISSSFAGATAYCLGGTGAIESVVLG